jgi:5'(3')-deoxyribonucleotidase
MKYRAIAIDCDDVVVETAQCIVDYYNKTYGTKLAFGDIYTKDLQRLNVPDIATAIGRMEVYLESEDCRLLSPSGEAIAVMKRLARRYKLHIVTGRSSRIEAATRDMLQRHLPGILTSVTFTNFFNHKVTHKADVCREIGADLLIDDHLPHVLPAAQAGIDTLLFGSYPWNQTDQLPPNTRRVRSWREVAELLLPM